MQLIKPSKKYEDSWKEALAEFQAEGRKGLFDDYLKNPCDINQYIQLVKDHEVGKNLPADWVPAYTYWLVDDDKFIGRASIRPKMNTKKPGGQIGYNIRPSARRRGYGTKILKLALKKAKGLGLNKVLVTCDESNIASKKIIEKNKGQFESKVQGDKEMKLRYWIKL